MVNAVVIIVPHGNSGPAMVCIHVVVILSLETIVCVILNIHHATHPILLIYVVYDILPHAVIILSLAILTAWNLDLTSLLSTGSHGPSMQTVACASHVPLQKPVELNTLLIILYHDVIVAVFV